MPAVYTIKDIALAIGLDPSSARKTLRAQKIFPIGKKATAESKGQRCDVYSQEQYDLIIKLREDLGYGAEQFDGLPRSEHGYFYVIRLIPEYNPDRIKFGFTGSLLDRVNAHRTVAPTCEVLRSWPSRRHWELPAIECATKNSAVRLGLEVFDIENVDEMLQRLDAFFGLMPDV